MKKVFKISSLMAILLSVANSSFATSDGITSALSSKMPVIVGVILIIFVLFIGYKMDRAADGYRGTKKFKQARKEREAEKKAEREEAELYANENKEDMPYENDKNVHYEGDKDVDVSGLNEEEEYEEDDVSVFSENNGVEPSFNNIDEDLSFESVEKSKEEDFNSTMIFDSSKLNEDIDALDDDDDDIYIPESVRRAEEEAAAAEADGFMTESEEPEDVEEVEEEVQEEYEYTDAVEGLDEKIDSLDDLDDIEEETPVAPVNPEPVQEAPVQDAQDFMNDLKRLEEDESTDFGGFSSSASTTTPAIDIDDNVSEEPMVEVTEEKEEVLMPAHKRYTKKRDNVILSHKQEEVSSVDDGFLAQMDQTMKETQEKKTKKSNSSKSTSTKTKKTTKKADKETEEKPKKKSTRKSTKKE